MTTATVVGSGPNGLSAAVTLAMSGIEVTVLEMADAVGGGTRTSELTLPGVLHDDCSAVHPIGAASPFFNSLDLERHGLRWKYPEIDAVQPLDNGSAGVLHRSISDTAAGLSTDGDAWRRFFEPLSDRFDDLAADFFRPMLHVPKHPVTLTRFGLNALAPATLTARRFHTQEARALFSGIAAHALYPLTRPTTSAVGVMMIAAGHKYGWPVAEGGSRAISDALVSVLAEHGGKVETGVRVRHLTEIPPSDIVMLDLSPTAVADIAGDALPARVARPYRRWRYGPGAFKLDLAVHEGIPWTNHSARRAGTVHLGGTLEEVAAAERAVHRGDMPARPFVLVAQQYLADPTRSHDDIHPIWTYAHVPNGYTGDASEAIIDQIERFAPGVRDRIVGRAVRSTTQMPAYNPNYVGGDIVTGSNDPGQVVLRPRVSANPYWTGIDGVYICSAATPPGGGVHGMGGYNAACAALESVTRTEANIGS
ncbi:FAD-dependent oxidoreductase [Rhodococcus sp. 05-340-1]|uniref:phytoene desaturase family protein n=1 Tax=unclassified Rhodococcus (in: high G+C Gram-positive bacteria) TaxID=192944 RepID=UPI000B9A5AEA|nr:MULTISPECIES: NAD(P)/FAD-dependent oxidoreductase [unclassified Rhodococcus (in: high G+C Gram-positive bacteria)]OZD62127.1 FAD-dependent oxidoreductase [Rhodococcus sp. 05-340-2]OZD78414.1 FAD-dependent oxidoreductase [Rhodococcus sp. 05-340-1]